MMRGRGVGCGAGSCVGETRCRESGGERAAQLCLCIEHCHASLSRCPSRVLSRARLPLDQCCWQAGVDLGSSTMEGEYRGGKLVKVGEGQVGARGGCRMGGMERCEERLG